MLRTLIKLTLLASIGYYSVALASVNGIWKDSQDKFWLYLDEQNTTVAVEIKGDLTGPNIYIGSLNNSNLDVKTVLASLQLTGVISTTEDSISGILTTDGVTSDYVASKIFSYEGSNTDGLWLVEPNHYLLYLSVNREGNPLIVVLDMTINPDQTIQHDIFVGSVTQNGFLGTSLLNDNLSMNLGFTAEEIILNGKYIVKAIPPQTTEFTANRIFLVDPENLTLETLQSEFDKNQFVEFITLALSESAFNQMQSKEAKLASAMVEGLTEAQKIEISQDLVAKQAQKAKCSDLNYPDFWDWAGLCQ